MSAKYNEEDSSISCGVCELCGGCQYVDVTYEKELKLKYKLVSELFKDMAKCENIIGMYRPAFYRNKVSRTIGYNRDKSIITGIYQEGTHRKIAVDNCVIEDRESNEIINTLRKLFKSFKYEPYNEDTKRGFIRHILIRKGFSTKEIMVVLVTGDVAFPSKKHFIKALLEEHPKITTIVQNVNNMSTSMVLGKRNITIYGKGYIEDTLCGCRFRLSPESFYQINPAQTEKLYKTAIKAANIKKSDKVIDAYCGIGTIGIVAAANAGQVIGVELNAQAVSDAKKNAAINNVKNIQFVNDDAGKFLVEYAQSSKADVVIMDPPRSGSSKEFLDSLLKIKPERIVYISCEPETQARDVRVLMRGGYKVHMCQPFDMFPHTVCIENIVVLTR